MRSFSIFYLAWLFLILSISSCSDELIMPEEMMEEPISETVALIAALDEVIMPLSDKPLEMADQEISFLDDLKNTKIVAFGEATHGTREFFQMKHRMFRYLVENHGFKAFVFEIDMGEALLFNDWVQHRSDEDLTTLMVEKMNFTVWKTEEVRELLIWMREYNDDKSTSEMIGFYGVDCQFGTYNVNALADIIAQVDQSAADEILGLSQNYMNVKEVYRNNDVDSVSQIVKEEIRQIKFIVDNLSESVESNLSLQKAMLAKRLMRNIIQNEEVAYDAITISNTYKRDLFMAENSSWYLDYLGMDAKIVLWAHNAHVAADDAYREFGSQGWYLKQNHGNNYQIIGFSFSKGSFTARVDGVMQPAEITTDPIDGSTQWYFQLTQYDNFVLKTLQSDIALSKWMRETAPYIVVGAGFDYEWPAWYSYYPLPMSDHFDYVIHFEESNHSRLLSQ